MPARKKITIEEYWADELQDDLAQRGFRYLRVRRRADLLVLESGPSNAPWPHARFRRETVHLWRLEFPTHSGAWETTPFRDQLPHLVDTLINDFPWTLNNDT
jgi:hypothetical protein